MYNVLNLNLIEQADKFLEDKIYRTPIEFSSGLSHLAGSTVYLKLESEQITGSFKVRGSQFYLSTLTHEEKQKGVAACSAGNHGHGIAYAAKKAGIPCTIYLPKSVDSAKSQMIQKLDAKVVFSPFNGFDDTLVWAQKDIQRTGQHFISAFEDPRIMAGNGGTLAKEILKSVPDVANVVFPVSGGGLASGITYYFKEHNPSIRMIGCQHIDSPALRISLDQGKAATVLPAIETLAGGLEGGIGEQCFEILKDRVDDLVLLTEDEIGEGVRWMLANHQYLIEPTAAVTVSSFLSKKIPKLSGKTVVLLSGRNISYENLKKLIR
jgi:threonine dehydratase